MIASAGELRLDPPHDVNEPRHARQRVFRRHRRSHDGQVEGTVHIGVEVGIADGDVHQRRAGLCEKADDFDGLRQIGLGRILFVYAEAVGIGHGIVGIHARGHGDSGNGVLDLAHHVAEKARPVLEGAAVAALPRVRGVQL